MIDDLEARAEAYAIRTYGSHPNDQGEMYNGKLDFIAGARSQDELAYQRGRQEVLDSLEFKLSNELIAKQTRMDMQEIIHQLRTEVKG